ncbi:MAG: hypothetical protein ACRC2J_14240 [Microcoleaceae cyanobacterium]
MINGLTLPPLKRGYSCRIQIKRHLAVDILGFPFFSHCTKASLSDDQGLIEMLTKNIDYFKLKPEELPKITILVDQGYHPAKIIVELTLSPLQPKA